MDGFRVVKLSEVIRQMDVVITCTGTLHRAVAANTSASIVTMIQCRTTKSPEPLSAAEF